MANHVQDSPTLDHIQLLAGLTQVQRDQLCRQCRWKRYHADEQIIDNQSDSSDIFFVVAGVVRVVNYSASGREVALEDIGPGGHFGELAALDGAPRSANVVAQEETLVAVLPAEHFHRLLRASPDVALGVMLGLARVIRQATDRIMDLSTLGANNRVHAELLRQARMVSKDGRKASIQPIPVHSDIASRVSTTRETVARVLSDLTRAGLVKRDKDALRIMDIQRLQTMVDDVRGEA